MDSQKYSDFKNIGESRKDVSFEIVSISQDIKVRYDLKTDLLSFVKKMDFNKIPIWIEVCENGSKMLRTEVETFIESSKRPYIRKVKLSSLEGECWIPETGFASDFCLRTGILCAGELHWSLHPIFDGVPEILRKYFCRSHWWLPQNYQ